MNNKLISVILPVYNAERYLKKSIKSVLDQTYHNIELIIIDDGSEDSSTTIIQNFKDNRIKFYTHSHQGLIAQLNFALQEASGKYIARMDADDIGDLNRLAIQVAFLEEHPDIQLVSTNYNYIDENDKIISHKAMPENHENIEYMLPILNSICHAGMLTYKDAILDAGSYSEKFVFVEDQELFLRMISNGIRMYNIQKFLYSYRFNKNRLSKQHRNILLKNRYILGSEYLNKLYKNSENNFHYNLRYGLLEYYSGNVNTARNYFLKSLRLAKDNKKGIYRFLLPSLLGDNIIKFLRSTDILAGISSIMNKIGKDFHIIVKNEEI